MNAHRATDDRAIGVRFPLHALALVAAFLGLLACPVVSENEHVTRTFLSIGAAFTSWAVILWIAAWRRGRRFEAQFVSVRSHWVQAAVQASILVYWGWFVPAVPHQAPLILAQILYLYAFDALLSWTRGRAWRAGFGPLPIVLSTNLLLWFRPDWFALQFVMLTIGALGKNFVTWERDGKRTHVFNPSAFGQSIVAIALIATGTTKDLTLGKEIAASFSPPHMLVVIFLGGLIVQGLFHVTLMTLSAAATLCVVGLAYHAVHGTYLFVNVNVAAPIFLGIHLLMTDPATSPRTNVGRILFGALYALGYATLFRVFDVYEVPTFWDKLLPVPLLNLSVPWIDRFARSGFVGRLNTAWETLARPARLNLVHMSCWIALFLAWIATGFVEAPHPGDSIAFWKKAVQERKPHAGNSLVLAAGSLAEANGSAAAWNELGVICFEGQIVKPNHERAAEFFAKASDLGDPNGALNVVSQFLFHGERLSDLALARAFGRLETLCARGYEGPACWLLARAHETGQGRAYDPRRALELYMRCDMSNPYAAKGIARLAMITTVPPAVLAHARSVLESARAAGDAESCWYLAYLELSGTSAPRDEAAARRLLQEACALGATKACTVLASETLPPFSPPDSMSVPPMATAFPLP